MAGGRRGPRTFLTPGRRSCRTARGGAGWRARTLLTPWRASPKPSACSLPLGEASSTRREIERRARLRSRLVPNAMFGDHVLGHRPWVAKPTAATAAAAIGPRFNLCSFTHESSARVRMPHSRRSSCTSCSTAEARDREPRDLKWRAPRGAVRRRGGLCWRPVLVF